MRLKLRGRYPTLELPVRIISGLGGGYLVANGTVALCGAIIPAFGVQTGEAVLVGTLIAFPLLVGIVIWAFGTHKWRRMTTIVFCLGGLMISSAMFLTTRVLVDG